MEKFNFKGGENILKSFCWILSYLSWLLVAVNNLASLKYMYADDYRKIWCIITKIKGYYPIQMDRIVIYIVYNIWILISFIGCVVFIVKTLFRKDNSVIDGMMGKFSQFHFFPLLCAFIMTILGEIKVDEHFKHIINTGLAFSLIGTASMVFIYIMTDFKTQDWWAEYTLKKGTFSCLIILFFYNFCYDVYGVEVANNLEKIPQNFDKNCGIAFSIIFGIGSLAFSVVFKDIILSFMNFLINIGMAKYYFELEDTSTKEYNKNADGAFDIIISVLSLIWFLYLVIGIFMEEVQKLKQQVLNINQVQTLTIAKVNTNSEQINLISSNVNIPANNFGATDKN